MKIINDLKKCNGCSACYNICPTQAIKMLPTKEGFIYPTIDKKKCIDCGLCYKTCPINSKKFEISPKISFAGFANDETIRLNSSSGGIFSCIAIDVLNNKGVVFGASLNEKLKVWEIEKNT